MEASRPVHGFIRRSRWLLRIAGLLVPKSQRKAWYEEQCAQIWHWAHFLHESGRLNAATRLDLEKHLWGAFSNALWHRFDRDKAVKWLSEGPRTPRFCLSVIAAVLLIAIISTGFAPTIRSSLSRLPYGNADRLADLSFNNNFIHYHSDTLFVAASRWAAQSTTTDAIAAYSWQPADLATPGGSLSVISARVSPDFFDVLGVGAGRGRLFHSGDDKQCANCVVISHHLWQYGFHSDPAVIGKQIAFQDGTFTVVGVLSSYFWFTSPEISIWTVNESHVRSFNSAARTGAVLRLRPGATVKEAAREFSRLITQAGNFGGIDITSLKDRVRQGTEIYLLFILLAFLGSLALLAYRLRSSSGPRIRLQLHENHRWWLFFAAKTLLLLVTCLVVSLEGTRRAFLMFTGAIPPFAGPVCTWLFLVTTVLAITWSLHDQGRRCRFCLKRLGHEIYVGAPACLLLDWWGTELVCSQGHGMLHVPEMHASWLEMEHWTPLDDSWKPLFESESEDVKV